MGVQTTADNHIDEVRKNIAEAVKHLNAVLVEGCWGADEYRKDYHDKLVDMQAQLLKMQRDL